MAPLTAGAFVERRAALASYAEKEELLKAAIDTENEYRGLFARHRESWEIPEVEDAHVGLIDVYAHPDAFRCLPRYAEDTAPRCFELGEKRLPEGELAIVDGLKEFEQSWDCFTESQLRFLDWSHVFAAGGSVAGCLSPLPEKVRSGGWAEGRKKRRTYFHDEANPGSDVDLFLYGLEAAQAERKLEEIFDAVQAANPYEVLCFRSAHAVTLVSQYPFRHIQIVLRLYNSPAEVLMGFDVDSCACGYDGKRAYVCQRTVFAFAAQANTVDMSRRSPSYEMRLSKYAQRGFEVVVPGLLRERVDPSLYERRFDQVQGLARLLLLERLSTPEARFRYRIEQQLKRAARNEQYRLRRQLNRVLRDRHELARMEDSIVPTASAAGAEVSNYSTVFLPWGPAWNAQKVKRVMAKKDRALNSVEFLPGGRVGKCTRKYKVHVCACGSMPEVIGDCFPDDPPVPADVPKASLEQCIRGRVTWLADNPGRQQIGSFHPITEGDWMQGTYLSAAMEGLSALCAVDDAKAIEELLSSEAGSDQLSRRDFLGRSALHIAVLCDAAKACEALLAMPTTGPEILDARLADGRTVFHLAAMRGFTGVLGQLLEKREQLLAQAEGQVEDEGAGVRQLDLDGADWELKLSPLQYAVVLGHTETVEALLRAGASPKKIAVHKEKSMSRSTLALCAAFASESSHSVAAESIVRQLLQAGASTAQVDAKSRTVWHELAGRRECAHVLELFLKSDPQRLQTLDVVDSGGRTPLAEAVQAGNAQAVKLLLAHGAADHLSQEEYTSRKKRAAAGGSCRDSPFGGNGGFGFGFGSGGYTVGFALPMKGEEMSRCPILQAALKLQLDCVRAFLEHSPACVASAGSDRDGQLRSVLEVVQARRAELESESSKREKARAGREKAVQAAKKALSAAAEGSYGHSMWSFILWKAQYFMEMERVQEEMQDTFDEFAEEAVDAAQATRNDQRAEELLKLVESFGGKPHPREEGEEPQQQQQQQPSHFGGGLFGGGLFNKPTSAPNLMKDYGELGPSSNPRFTWGLKRLPAGEQALAHELFDAAFRGDPDAARDAGKRVRVTVINALGLTPMWCAASQGHVECARVLFAVASEQFSPAEPSDSKEKADPNDISSQLKRMNNLELAAGSGPVQEKGPSPEQVRSKLEALEQGVVAGAGQEDSAGATATDTPPEVLLLARSLCRVEEEGALAELMRRLVALAGPSTSFEDPMAPKLSKLGRVVRLSPLEIAIVRGDLAMVEALLALARGAGGGDDGEGEGDQDPDEQDEGDDGGSEDGEDAGVEPQGRTSRKQLVYDLLLSSNQDLEVTPLQLSVMQDSPEIFLALAAFAQEFALSESAARMWQAEVDAGQKTANSSHASLLQFGSDQTHLQLALAVGASRVARLILSGGADDALLGWLEAAAAAECPGKASAQRPPADGPRAPPQHGLARWAALRKWLVDHVRASGAGREELSRRLVGPRAPDARGRTALFYATSAMLPVLLEGGGGEVDLEHRTRSVAATAGKDAPPGVTALMAAAHGGRHEEVAVLLKAGCKITAVGGEQNRNCLHLAVQGASSDDGNEELQDRALQTVEVLLAAASPEEARALLFAPDAEHTPLMLAAQLGVRAPLVRLLAERMIAAGESGEAALARRDGQMSSAMHHAAGVSRPEVVQTLLDVGRASGHEAVASSLGPHAENAAGATPLEVLMEKVAEVWNQPGVQQMYDHGRRPRRSAKEQSSAASEERRCLELLSSVEARQRKPVSFDDVRQATQDATAKAGSADTVESTLGGNVCRITIVHGHSFRQCTQEHVFPTIRD